jgi:hypothetical protein
MPKGIYSNPTERSRIISEGLKKAYAEGRRLKVFSGKRGGFKKGVTPWNKGKTGVMPQAWNKGIKGLMRANSGSFKKGQVPSGKTNPNWKGGITTQNRMDRNKFKMEIQKTVLERDNYTCQLCQVRGGILQVDHIQPWAEYVELRFDINNCRTLCMKCHYEITFGKPMPENTKTWGINNKQLEGRIG